MKTRDIIQEGTIEDLKKAERKYTKINGRYIGYVDNTTSVQFSPNGGKIIRFNKNDWFKIQVPNDVTPDLMVNNLFNKGDVIYINDKKQFHNENGPAVSHMSGEKYWYKNGEKHRDDGPAITYADGSQEWWKNGKLHRDDGPAVIYSDGRQEWYYKGQLLKIKERDGTIKEFG